MTHDINAKIIKAHETFLAWRNVSFVERQKLILRASEILKSHTEDFAKIITKEMHKPISQAIAEVQKCALLMDYYAKVENILVPEKIESEYQISEIHFVPKGIILGVMPWNFPFWQVLRFAIPAILSGNTILIKHASICFESGNTIEKLLIDAEFPEGILQNLEVGHSEVKTILEHQWVRGVSLTGSEKAGAEVASLAGENIKKSMLELGGSDAFIILDDADIQEATEAGTLARLQNCGQTCVAAKRYIVQENIFDEVLERFVTEFHKFVPNDPFDKATKISGLARPNLADELEKQYRRAVDSGAKIVLPLQRLSEISFMPSLLIVEEDNPILQEEVFGPIGILLKVKDDADALRLANATPYGLSNSVWTTSEERREFFIRNLESWTININRMTSSDQRFPFGGTKMSGYGVELSLLALKEFVDVKTILMK